MPPITLKSSNKDAILERTKPGVSFKDSAEVVPQPIYDSPTTSSPAMSPRVEPDTAASLDVLKSEEAASTSSFYTAVESSERKSDANSQPQESSPVTSPQVEIPEFAERRQASLRQGSLRKLASQNTVPQSRGPQQTVPQQTVLQQPISQQPVPQ